MFKSAFKADDSVEADSPKASPQPLEFKSLGGKPLTAPVLKRTSDEVSSQPQASTSSASLLCIIYRYNIILFYTNENTFTLVSP